MQRRFCECGGLVWVQYVLFASHCRAVFWTAPHGSGTALHRCPRCGRQLDIDELR